MAQRDCNTVFLKKGKYLAPEYFTTDFEDLLIGVSKYEVPTKTGIWHSHEKPLISFVLYGSNMEYRKGKTIERKTGAINFYHSNEMHKNVYSKFPSKHISLEIDSNFLINCGYGENEVELALRKYNDTSFTFIKLMQEAIIHDSQSKSTAEMLFVEFMENSLKVKNEKYFPAWIKSVRDILNDRWNENITLLELAETVGVHPCSISRYFRKYFNCTLGEYTRKLKVKHAIDFLNASHYSLTEVTYLCGFSDQSHFTRSFKTYTGYLPKEYSKVS